MDNVNVADDKDFGNDCPICFDEVHLPGERLHISSKGLKFLCGHRIHAICAREMNRLRRITKCFFCKEPVDSSLIPVPNFRDRVVVAYERNCQSLPEKFSIVGFFCAQLGFCGVLSLFFPSLQRTAPSLQRTAMDRSDRNLSIDIAFVFSSNVFGWYIGRSLGRSFGHWVSERRPIRVVLVGGATVVAEALRSCLYP